MILHRQSSHDSNRAYPFPEARGDKIGVYSVNVTAFVDGDIAETEVNDRHSVCR